MGIIFYAFKFFTFQIYIYIYLIMKELLKYKQLAALRVGLGVSIFLTHQFKTSMLSKGKKTN